MSTGYKRNGTETLFSHSCFTGEGFLSQDTLHVAGLEIIDQLFHELPDVQQIWTDPYTQYFDSVLSLTPRSEQSLADTPDPFQIMVTQGLLDNNITSFSLPSSGVGWGYPGEITYDGINHGQYVNHLKYIPLSNVTDPDRGLNDPLVKSPPLLKGNWKVKTRALFWGN